MDSGAARDKRFAGAKALVVFLGRRQKISQWKFSRSLSVEQILSPLVIRMTHEPHDVPTGVEIECMRLAH